ncbi:MAG: Hpt domain-containing protein [Halomonadaceae bacterium]|nr:MAG: Hpt domain-containing protein [Halomonadaceae bacterium]
MNEISHLDHEALSELQEVMEDEFEILISTFLQDSSERIQHLHQALESEAADDFSKAAHSLKGSSINIGATVLGERCKVAENAGRAGQLSPDQVVAIEEEFTLVEAQLKAYLKHH